MKKPMRSRGGISRPLVFIVALVGVGSATPSIAADAKDRSRAVDRSDLRTDRWSFRQNRPSQLEPTTKPEQTDASSVKFINRRPAVSDSTTEADASSSSSLAGQPPPAETPQWTFTAELPIAYNSNVALEASNPPAAWHTDPSISLAWTKDVRKLHVDASLSADSDRYSDFAENDGGQIVGELKLTLPDALGKDWGAYVRYTPQVATSRGFSKQVATVHDLAAGLSHTFCLKVGGSDCGGSGDKTTLGTGLEFIHRAADPITKTSDGVQATVTFNRPVATGLKFKLQERVRFQSYSKDTNVGRRDVKLNTLAELAWGPASFKHTSFRIGVNFVRNVSNRSANSYSQWDIGPTISFETDF